MYRHKKSTWKQKFVGSKNTLTTSSPGANPTITRYILCTYNAILVVKNYNETNLLDSTLLNIKFFFPWCKNDLAFYNEALWM
jgi:hypothetical protein